jgi:hypothetical protein
MNICTTNAITNDGAFTKDYIIKIGYAVVFGFSFYEDRAKTVSLPVDDVEFKLTVKNTAGATSLTILNADWVRPETNHIQKIYTAFNILAAGVYTYELSGKYPDDMVLFIGKGKINVS